MALVPRPSPPPPCSSLSVLGRPFPLPFSSVALGGQPPPRPHNRRCSGSAPCGTPMFDPMAVMSHVTQRVWRAAASSDPAPQPRRWPRRSRSSPLECWPAPHLLGVGRAPTGQIWSCDLALLSWKVVCRSCGGVVAGASVSPRTPVMGGAPDSLGEFCAPWLHSESEGTRHEGPHTVRMITGRLT